MTYLKAAAALSVVTLSIFNGVTGKLGMVCTVEVGHAIVVVIILSEISAAFPLSHSSSLAFPVMHNGLQG